MLANESSPGAASGCIKTSCLNSKRQPQHLVKWHKQKPDPTVWCGVSSHPLVSVVCTQEPPRVPSTQSTGTRAPCLRASSGTHPSGQVHPLACTAYLGKRPLRGRQLQHEHVVGVASTAQLALCRYRYALARRSDTAATSQAELPRTGYLARVPRAAKGMGLLVVFLFFPPVFFSFLSDTYNTRPPRAHTHSRR